MSQKKESIEERLALLLCHLLDLPTGTPTAALCRQQLPAWDSLRHIKIVLAVQKEFGQKFSAAEIIRLDSLAAFREALAAKIS